MDVGLQIILSSYGWPDISDDQVYRDEIGLVMLAEKLGFDAVWPTEHHFFDYSFCPDNLQLLAYLAGCTQSIDLGTAAVIMPWNEPLRVAEKVALLDNISGGRVRFGMGRGLSQREFAPFRGIEMEESRERFDESSQMVVNALETGFIEGDGPFYVGVGGQKAVDELVDAYLTQLGRLSAVTLIAFHFIEVVPHQIIVLQVPTNWRLVFVMAA
jgi:alkanesulfonate monooxygenase SsuD/methylene tetrahydromethanopterin reductase-like flavin-dependent oxidoreductase (luciferase family)